MRKIVTDVTYIRYRRKRYYLAAYLDLFNTQVLERELSDTIDHFFVMTIRKITKKNEHGTPSMESFWGKFMDVLRDPFPLLGKG